MAHHDCVIIPLMSVGPPSIRAFGTSALSCSHPHRQALRLPALIQELCSGALKLISHAIASAVYRCSGILPCSWTWTFNHVAYGTRHSHRYRRPRQQGHKGMVTAVVAKVWSVLGPRSTDVCACRSKRTGARLFLLCERPLMSQYASLSNLSAAHYRCKQAFFHCRCGIAWDGTASTSTRTIRLVDLPHAAIAFQVCKVAGCR